MKRVAFVLFFAIASSAVAAEETSEPKQASGISEVELESKPSTAKLSNAFAHSGLNSITITVIVAYDALGNVVGVKLDKATGSEDLDRAILAWAALVKVRAAQAGYGSIPIRLKKYG